MYTIYRLNADELTVEFLEALKTMFQHKTIEIAVCEAEQAEQDETAYLLSNPANRARLLEAVENAANKKNLIFMDFDELADENRF
ncbi:MAG: hypothetical protein GY862_38070 [Gammaproteobacteria bacterium]|nr:hypothetical protein [Gammaproteobacteria bacterium]